MSSSSNAARKAPVLILGASGQVGQALLAQLPVALTALTPSHAELDVLIPGALTDFVDRMRPALVINCVAYNQVDQAERDTALAERLNHGAVLELVNACAAQSIPLVHFSTDYVFPGKNAAEDTRLYSETDATGPVNYYGVTKLAGERAALTQARNLVLRVSWVFSEFARNMGERLVAQAHAGVPMQVANDQFGSPTYAGHIAQVVWLLAAELLAGAEGGLYHLSGTQAVSRYDLACAIVNEAKQQAWVDANYQPMPMSQVAWRASASSTTANRPDWSALGCNKLSQRLRQPLPCWRDGLRALVSGLKH